MASVHKNAAFIAAQEGMNHPAMDAAANRFRGHALRLAAESRLTGRFMDSIQVAKVRGERGRGVRIWDRLVYSDDSGALAIEYGHQQGETHVPGKHVFGRARDAM